MSQVKDILQNRVLFSVEPDQTVAEVAARMAELNIGAILVLNRGRLCGVFSERDLMTRVVVARRNPDATRVSEVMTADPVTVDDSASLDDARVRMHEHRCRHLPVVRGPHVVGFLSMRDLTDHELNRQGEELHLMRAYIHGNV